MAEDKLKILFSNLGEDIKEVQVAAGKTLREFLAGAGYEDNKETMENLRVNGLIVSGLSEELKEGDYVMVVPKLAGGR